MFGVSLLAGLLIIWAVVTGAVVVLAIYRSTLSSPGEERLFLGGEGDVIEREHQNTLRKEKRLAPFLYVLGTLSVILLLSIAGLWLWQGLLMT